MSAFQGSGTIFLVKVFYTATAFQGFHQQRAMAQCSLIHRHFCMTADQFCLFAARQCVQIISRRNLLLTRKDKNTNNDQTDRRTILRVADNNGILSNSHIYIREFLRPQFYHDQSQLGFLFSVSGHHKPASQGRIKPASQFS